MRTRSLAQILILLLATLVPKTASADRTDDGVHSVRFQVRGEQIHVMYDLVAAGTCQISLRMLHGSVEAPVQPRSLSGDVGAGITSGNKLIVWDVLADVAQLEGSDYVFEVSAIKQNRNGRWLWLGGAGLLAGAGAAYFMTSGDAATPEATGIFDIDIPDPHVAEETTQ